jgi:hypothetical protein
VKAATFSALIPAARGKPNKAEPEHSDIVEGCRPASSRARAAPTSDAIAPLPPVAASAIRSSLRTKGAYGCDGGNGFLVPVSPRALPSAAEAASVRSPVSCRSSPNNSRARVIALKY